jgi:hypothetical protein
MTEQQWPTSNDPEPMLDFLRGKASDRKLRLFAVACCRRAWHLLVDERSRKAVEVAERFAERAATDQELDAVRQAAWEFTLHIVHEDEAFSDLDAAFLNAADIPAWTSDESLQPIRVVIAAQRCLGVVESKAQAELLRCIIGNPFHPVTINPTWRTSTVLALAQATYDNRDLPTGTLEPARLAILADALEDIGCSDAAFLQHLREAGLHVRGCFAVDLLLVK